MAEIPPVAPRRGRLRTHAAFLVVLFVTLAAALAFVNLHPPVKFRGDEEPYARIAHEDYPSTNPLTRCLPGGLRFHYWPPLSFALYSYFGTQELERHFAGAQELEEAELNAAIARFLDPIVVLNLVFLVLAVSAVYGLGLTLGAVPGAAAAATALFALNPRVLFYVQALWPELLHFALFLPALLLLARHLRRASATSLDASPSPVPLVGASLLFAYAALTKGISALYVHLLLLLFVWWFRGRWRTRAALVTLVALFVPFHALLLTQRAANLASDDAFAISSNSWVNIEKGLIPASVAVDAGFKNTSERYAQAAPDQMGRERASRQRVSEYLEAQPWTAVFGHLVRQYPNLASNSFFERGLYTDRWTDPAGLLTFESIAVALSWCLLLFGILGALACCGQDRAASALALFLAYYLGSLFLVGWNERFLIQALPVLAAFTALVFDRLFRRAPLAGGV